MSSLLFTNELVNGQLPNEAGIMETGISDIVFAHSRGHFRPNPEKGKENTPAHKCVRWGQGLSRVEHFPDTRISILIVSSCLLYSWR